MIRTDAGLGRIDDRRVAIAHWGIEAWGGAEYLVTKLAETVEADTVYTMGEPEPDDPNPFGDVGFTDVIPKMSCPRFRALQSRVGRVFEYALWEDVDWCKHGDPDVVLTSGATTRGVITPDDTLHVNYCHSPPRWFYDRYHDRKDSFVGIIGRPLIRRLRTRDTAIDPRVDHYLANSPIISRRIWKYYKRDSTVLHPPIELDAYYDGGDGGFYLHLGRVDVEKGVPAIVDAFNSLDRRIVFAGGMGDVSDVVREQMNTMDNIDFRGFVSESEKIELLANCRAVVFNGRNEDFGIVPIEANASGKPVLVPDEGFPGLFVENGENGYKHDGTAAGIRQALNVLEKQGISGSLANSVNEFSVDRFDRKLRENISHSLEKLEL